MIKKETIFNLLDEYMAQKDEKEIQVDEIDGYIRLEAVLPTLSILLKLTPNGIKKYLEDIKVLKSENGKYVPNNRSKLIDNKIFVLKEVLERLVRLQVFVGIVETDSLDYLNEKYDKKRDIYVLQAYNMSNVEEKRGGAKFEKARELLKINNI